MQSRSFRALSILLAAAAVLWVSRASAAAPYYEGKVITIIVAYGPGGGYDKVARLLAKHLPKHIPGKPSVIVENMPGADGMMALNHLYNKAQPDGLTIATFNRGAVISQLLKAPGMRFDLSKLSWIGSAASEGTVLLIRSDLPYRSVEDLLRAKEPIAMGNTGPSDSSGLLPTMVFSGLGVKEKNVLYMSSAEVMLAVERKEVDGRGASYTSALPFIERGLVRPILRGRVIEPGMEKLPMDEDLVPDKLTKKVLAARSAPDQIGRPFAAPPKTPENLMAILRDAFAKAIVDPELKADADRQRMSLNYTPAVDTLKIVNEFLPTPPDVAKELAKYFKM